MPKGRTVNGGRRVPMLVALLPAAILVLATLNLAVPYYAIGPGPARDVKPMIELTGARTYPPGGELLLTTVQLRSTRIGEILVGWLDPLTDVVPRGNIVPRGKSEREIDRANADHMEESKRAAAASALALLGYPLHISGGARVESLMDGSPAAGVLRPGDVIVAADERPVNDANELIDNVRRHKVGEAVELRIRRDGRELDVEAPTMSSRRDPALAIIGIQVRTHAGSVDLPFPVRIDSGPIGGPSAGLMFALGIYDLLQDGDLTKGLSVAGTGVISVRGGVSAVGGVAQKVAAAERAGADVFLVPKEEERQARAAARRVRVVGVRNLSEAVQALHDLKLPLQASGRRP